MPPKNSDQRRVREGRVTIEKVPNSRNWYLRHSLHGRQKRKTTKTQSLKQARILAKELDAKLTLGIAPTSAARSRATVRPAVSSLLERLRERGRQPATLTVADYSYRKLSEFLRRGDQTLLNTIDTAALEAYERYLRGTAPGHDGKHLVRPLAPKTVREHLKNARRLLTFAVKRGLITMDPAAAYELPPAPAAKARGFAGQPLRDLLTDPVLGDLWRFFLHTGLRVNEFVWLTRQDVIPHADGRPRTLRIRRKTCPDTGKTWQPKGNRERLVPLTDFAAGVVASQLRKQPLPSERLFVTDTGGSAGLRPWTDSMLRHRLHARLAACGHPRQSPHAFRHTAATRMANTSTMPIAQVQRILGHADLTTTMRYVHPETEDIARSLEQVDFDQLSHDHEHDSTTP